jgi:predicted SnoaL-like aldol condensation-catalyzing enzyme
MGAIEAMSKAIAREAFDTLFNRRDYAAAERFWSPDYVQHSAHFPPGRAGLFDMVKSLPVELKRECDLIMTEGDMAMVCGRFSGHGQPAPWIAADFLRMEDGILVEHWDVIEEEASRKEFASGLPMYGDCFPDER